MFILFSFIVMRMSGAVFFNPILGRSNIPGAVKTAFVFMLSLMMYMGIGGALQHEPQSLLEFGFLLITELAFGFVIGFCMELTVLVIRFASSVMDFGMGLSMAQTYDPQYNMQVTVTSGLYYAFFVLLFFAVDGHVKLIEIFYRSSEVIPFGMVKINSELSAAMLGIFSQAIVLGLRFAFPLLAMELVTEFAVGILMKIIPQINVFVVNFQLKIIVGMMILLLLFTPMADRFYTLLDQMFAWVQELVTIMG